MFGEHWTGLEPFRTAGGASGHNWRAVAEAGTTSDNAKTIKGSSGSECNQGVSNAISKQ